MANTPAQLEALKALREAFPVGSTLYIILRKRSRSGGQAKVTLMGLEAWTHKAEGPMARPIFPHHSVAVTLGLKVSSWEGHDTVVLPGFTPQGWIAEQLSRAIHGDPTAITERAI